VKFPCSFGSGNFIPDPEKKLFHQDGCIEALHCQKTISSNTNAISILSFYLIFLLSYQKTISSNTNAISILSFYLIFLLSYQKIILLKKKTKKLSKMFSWTEQNH